jgi:hypothetical protein
MGGSLKILGSASEWAAQLGVKFHSSDIERMKALRAKGTSVRKLAADLQTTQWMAARLSSPDAALLSVSG